MKKILFILPILTISLISCNKWLEVRPKSEIIKDVVFSNEVGFHNALNGIYQKCSEPSLYGKTLSWGLLSCIAQNYASATNIVEQSAMRYLYQSERILPLINSVWSQSYNAIANCNILLNEIENVQPSLFTLDTTGRNVIKGEALALRAMLHLDWLRLFAPSVMNDLNATLVPYYDIYPSQITIPLTTVETLKRITDDLLKAKNLLAFHDTILNRNAINSRTARYDGSVLGTVDGGEFFSKRGFRMNYCAVIALLSRVHLYKGDYENAFIFAKHFYDEFIISDRRYFNFSSSSDYSGALASRQKKYLSESPFSFYNRNLLNTVENYYASNTLPIGDVVNIFYEDEDDYRLYLIEREVEGYGNSLKYRMVNSDMTDNVEGRAIPIFRMSEIYYTLIEYYYRMGDVDESLRLLKEYRSGKGCKRQILAISGQSELYDILINDARREFIGEGQLFFMYKRLNYPILFEGGNYPPIEERMTFQIPDSQFLN